MNANQRLHDHKNQSVHYFENALAYIQGGDAAKASEFQWGSAAQALKAVDAKTSIILEYEMPS